MFRATHRPSSGVQNCKCRLWFYIRFWLPVAAAIAETSQRQSETKNVCKTRGCNYSFELLMMGGVSPETCWSIKKHWNNKFYYTLASCYFFLWELYYDARTDPWAWSSWTSCLYIVCIIVRYRDDGSSSDRNMSVNSNIW